MLSWNINIYFWFSIFWTRFGFSEFIYFSNYVKQVSIVTVALGAIKHLICWRKKNDLKKKQKENFLMEKLSITLCVLMTEFVSE